MTSTAIGGQTEGETSSITAASDKEESAKEKEAVDQQSRHAQFSYKRLDPDQIRVLILKPGQYEDDLEGRLEEGLIEEADGTLYPSRSYNALYVGDFLPKFSKLIQMI